MKTVQSLFQHQSATTARTYTIMGVFFVVVIAIGYWLSVHFQNSAILYGLIGFSIVTNIVSYWFSDSIALRMSGASLADESEYREYYSITRNLCMKANLPMPKLYIMEEVVLNAFATGRDRNHSAVAVTSGLLQRLSRDEVEGVVAHELAHIGNKDILLMSVASIVAGLVAILADILGRNALLGDSENRGVLGFVAIIVSGILAQMGAAMIVAAVSRKREFLADETGALIVGRSDGLANALRKIAAYNTEPMEHAHQATAHMFIANPFGSWSPSRLFASHPPVEERIERLDAMR
jgi:heat shock protein HtpX